MINKEDKARQAPKSKNPTRGPRNRRRVNKYTMKKGAFARCAKQLINAKQTVGIRRRKPTPHWTYLYKTSGTEMNENQNVQLTYGSICHQH